MESDLKKDFTLENVVTNTQTNAQKVFSSEFSQAQHWKALA